MHRVNQKEEDRNEKNNDDTSKPEIEDVVKGKTRGQKPKKGDEIANAETSTDVVTEKKEDANQPHRKRKMLLRGREVDQKNVS